MKKFSLHLLFLLFTNFCTAQTKIFFNHLNEQCDSAKAASVLYFYNKMGADTVYRMEQYNMDKKLLTTGGYADAELKFVHGPFKYYSLTGSSQSELANDKGQRQQGIYLQEEGRFMHGKKEGLWTNYFADGTVKRKQNFTSDVLNGPYELFHQNGESYVKGDYLFGVKEGLWLENGGLDELTYGKGKLISSRKNKVLADELDKKAKAFRKYYVEAQPTTIFQQDLLKFMQDENTNHISLEKATVRLGINEMGYLKSVSVNGISDGIFRDKFKTYFLKHNKWQPATTGVAKKPIESILTYYLIFE